jgi:hypothetical protein
MLFVVISYKRSEIVLIDHVAGCVVFTDKGSRYFSGRFGFPFKLIGGKLSVGFFNKIDFLFLNCAPKIIIGI